MSSAGKNTITLTGGKPWGFRLTGGIDYNSLLKIEQITGEKARKGGLKADQIIYAINNNYTGGMAHQDAKNLIINSGQTLTLTVLESNVTPEYTELMTSASKSVSPKFQNSLKTSNDSINNPNSSKQSALKSLPQGIIDKTVPSNSKESINEEKNSISYGLNSTINKQDLDQKQKELSSRIEKLSTNSGNNSEMSGYNQSEINKNEAGLDSHSMIKSPFMKALEQHVAADMADGPISAPGKAGVTRIEPAVTYSVSKQSQPSSSIGKKSGGIGTSVTFPSTENKIKEKATITTPVRNTGNDQSEKSTAYVSDKQQCHRCGMLIGQKEFLRTNNFYFHKNHFTCSNCNTDLSTSGHIFEPSNQKLYCKSCHNEYFESSGPTNTSGASTSTNTSDTCALCHKNIIGSYLSAANKNYHPDCFQCKNCHTKLSKQPFHMDSGHPYCSPCYGQLFSEKCAKCQNAIVPGQPYLSVNDQTLHSSCFTCAICNSQLKSFKYRDNQAICPEH